MNYQEILNKGSKNLKNKKIKNPNLESELILSKVLNKSREQIILNSNNHINQNYIDIFRMHYT